MIKLSCSAELFIGLYSLWILYQPPVLPLFVTSGIPVAPEVAKLDRRTMNFSACKALDWSGTGVSDSICLEMDKELLILGKDYELIFFQSILSETRLINRDLFANVFVRFMVVFKPLKPDTARQCSLTMNKLCIKSAIVAWLTLYNLFVWRAE